MKTTKKNYIPFIAGMAAMALLACLISASLAKEDKLQPAPQPAAQVQAGDLRLARGEVGIALFGVERMAPGETLTAENGAEIPTVLTYTDENGETHYYVEAETIADILDVCYGANYRESLNCIDFGARPFVNDKGEISIKANGEPAWLTGRVKCDIDYSLRTIFYDDEDETEETIGIARSEQEISPPRTAEEQAAYEKRVEEHRQSTPLKPEYGITSGMYTEVDPAEVDMSSWSGTAVKGERFQSEPKGRSSRALPLRPIWEIMR